MMIMIMRKELIKIIKRRVFITKEQNFRREDIINITIIKKIKEILDKIRRYKSSMSKRNDSFYYRIILLLFKKLMF